MSNKGVVISLVLAIALGAIALGLLRGGSGEQGGHALSSRQAISIGERVLDFAPSGVVRVTIVDGSRTHTIVRTALIAGDPARSVGADATPPQWAPDAEWLLIGGAAAQNIAWPIPQSQLQGLLRTMAETTAVALPDLGSSTPTTPVSITLNMRDGSTRTLRMSDRAIAGTCMTMIDEGRPSGNAKPVNEQPPSQLAHGKVALVSDQLLRVCTNPGPSAWRERGVLASLVPEASRVRLSNAGRTLLMARIDGQWHLREPIAAPLDPAAVSALLGQLAGVKIAEFLDSPTPPSVKTGLEPDATPAASLTIESDRRSISPSTDFNAGIDAPVTVKTHSIRIDIGMPAGAEGARVFAQIDGTTLVQLDAGGGGDKPSGLAALSLDPGAYLWPHPLKIAAQDITAITIDLPGMKRELVRGVTRWGERTPAPGGAPADLSASDQQELERVLSFLTGGSGGQTTSPAKHPSGAPGSAQPRPAMHLSPPQSTLTPVGRVRVQHGSAQDAEIDVFATGHQTDQTRAVVLKSQGVWRHYTPEMLPAMLRPTGTPTRGEP